MRHFTLTALCICCTITLLNAQNVGVNDLTPDSTLSITNKLLIGGTQGDVVFKDDEGSIIFPATSVPNESMIYMFSTGSFNADRMAIAHSPAYPDWGLKYADSRDEFTFESPLNLNTLQITLGSGRIGVNTPSLSSARMAVNGNVQILSGFEAGLATDGYLQTGATTGSNLVMDNNEITARSNGAQSALWLQPNQGNVVIGTTSSNPTSTLHVSSDAGENPLRVQLIGTTKFLVDSTGVVVVNGFNKKAGYELNVDGQIVCEEVLVQNSADWPDYVFAEDYALPSLAEVERHIKEQKHLPDVPSAAQVAEEGILLADMEKAILRKVEELTLYVIQQSKEIEQLKKQNAELRSMIVNDNQ